MRIYITLSESNQLLPFNYQHVLTGVVHKWIGDNNSEHGERSLYSFSWLQNTIATKQGIRLNRGAHFFISAYDSTLLAKIIHGIRTDPSMFYGIEVVDIQIRRDPDFSTEERFLLNSPILIRKKENERRRHVTFEDEDFEQLLTDNLKAKLLFANLSAENVSVKLDHSYVNKRTKLVDYNGVKNKTTMAPVIICGTPEQISFAWSVGLGESTGVGFGSIR